MIFRSVRIALMVAAVACTLAAPVFAQPPQGEPPVEGEPIPAPQTPAADPCPSAGPAMQTICVVECVPETYTVKRIVYKQVCKQETFTAFKCERIPVTKTRTVTSYVKKPVMKEVVKTVYDKVPVCEDRTVMKPCWKTVQVTEMKTRRVDKGQWVCEEVPAPFRALCQRLGNGFGGHHRNACADPCADPCAVPCPPPVPTRTVKRWQSCWVTECHPVTVCKRVCEMVPEVRKVTTWKCVPRQITCQVCEYVCEPCVRTETYTCFETKQVPYTATRNVVTCVPCEEEVTCTRLVAKVVHRQVPVAPHGDCGPGPYTCCTNGRGHRLFSNFRGGLFSGHGHRNGGCPTTCGTGCH